MRLRLLVILALAVPLLGGCRDENVGEVIQHLRGPSYVRTFEAGDFRLEIRHVSETLYHLTFGAVDTSLVYSRALADSLAKSNGAAYGMMFTLTLSPRHDTLSPMDFHNDVVFGRLGGYDTYREGLDAMLFGFKERIWLEIGGKRHDLLTYHMTNSWGLVKSRTFNLVFAPPKQLLPDLKGEIALVTEDLFPGLGREKFQWTLPLSRLDFIQG